MKLSPSLLLSFSLYLSFSPVIIFHQRIARQLHEIRSVIRWEVGEAVRDSAAEAVNLNVYDWWFGIPPTSITQNYSTGFYRDPVNRGGRKFRLQLSLNELRTTIARFSDGLPNPNFSSRPPNHRSPISRGSEISAVIEINNSNRFVPRLYRLLFFFFFFFINYTNPLEVVWGRFIREIWKSVARRRLTSSISIAVIFYTYFCT